MTTASPAAATQPTDMSLRCSSSSSHCDADSLTQLPRVLHVPIAVHLSAREVLGLRCLHRVLVDATHDSLAYARSVCWTPQSVDELRSVLLCSTATQLQETGGTITQAGRTTTDSDAIPAAAAASSMSPSWLWPAAAIRPSSEANRSHQCRAVLAQLSRVSLDRCHGLCDSDLCSLLSLCTALTKLSVGTVAARSLTSHLD